MNIVVVESPAKAKTINKYLGSGYEVLASFGHVRDLPAKDGSVDPEHDFHMIWEVDDKSQKRLNDIARAVKGAEQADPGHRPRPRGRGDLLARARGAEGEARAQGAGGRAGGVQRHHQAGGARGDEASAQIDGALVDAYLARRALDYLVGFTLSPVLWRKLPGARSAGRVQSVALRLVCDRELEIEKFVPREYWSLVATLATPRGDTFEARLVGADGQKIQRLDIGSGAEAEAFKQALESAALQRSPTSRPSPPSAIRRRRSPPRPCSRRRAASSASRPRTPCGWRSGSTRASISSGETVGLITYMRTDGVQIAEEAIAAARRVIGADYGQRYVPDAPAPLPDQGEERAGGARGDPPDRSRPPSQADQSVPRSRPGAALRADLAAHDGEPDGIGRARAHHRRHHRQGRRAAHRYNVIDLRATGTVVKFDGFLTLYHEDRDDPGDDDESASACRR